MKPFVQSRLNDDLDGCHLPTPPGSPLVSALTGGFVTKLGSQARDIAMLEPKRALVWVTKPPGGGPGSCGCFSTSLPLTRRVPCNWRLSGDRLRSRSGGLGKIFGAAASFKPSTPSAVLVKHKVIDIDVSRRKACDCRFCLETHQVKRAAIRSSDQAKGSQHPT